MAGTGAFFPFIDGEAAMKALRFALLLLIAAAPLVSASDWLNWRKTGDATLTWGPFTVYTSQLRTPQGRYIAADQDQALIITYARDITRYELVDATREQWQALGILTQEAQSQAWLRTLTTLWPDVLVSRFGGAKSLYPAGATAIPGVQHQLSGHLARSPYAIPQAASAAHWR